MFRILFTLILAASVLVSCKKLNPETNPGIKSLIARLKTENPGCTCLPSLGKYNWKNTVVYALVYAGPACLTTPSFYDANGEAMTFPAGYDFLQFFQDSKLLENVWVCQ